MNGRKDLGPQLSALSQKLGEAQGKHYWRTLDELANTEAFQELMRLEFPEQADIWPDTLSRRHFLTLMGASLALAGLGGCSVKPAPLAKIVPYVNPPRDIVPGKPLFFATTMPFAGSAVGLLVESHMGRPTKIEGNPDHPASRGATSIYHQASILTLYDPDRSQSVTFRGRTRTWNEALAALHTALDTQQSKKGAGVRILSEPILSPSLAETREAFAKAMPQAKWHTYEPIHNDAALQGTRLAFGQNLNFYYDFRKADVVLSLDEDFLSSRPEHLRSVADFMSRRRVRTTAEQSGQAQMNRLYVVETAVTTTGAKADHRLALPAQEIEGFARLLATKLGISDSGRNASPHDKWAAALAKDLQQHQGRCLILAGERQPAVVHLLAHALNHSLGNIGQTVLFTDPIEHQPTERTASLLELKQDMQQGKVELLVVLAANPVYNAPIDFDFAEQLERVPLRVHVGLYQDETARLCHWHLPEAHYLEAWGDARTYDGTASICQPLIEPLYGGRSVLEIAAFLATLQETPGEEIVRKHWRDYWTGEKRKPASEFPDFWKTSLHDGLVRDTALPTKTVEPKENWQQHLQTNTGAALTASATAPGPAAFELVFQPDPTVYDGCFANNGWLQELPKPLTKLAWDNAALMSPATAKELGVGVGEYAHGGEHGGYHMPLVTLDLDGRTVRAPVWIMPGHADRSITVSLGYGRVFAGRVGGMPQGRRFSNEVIQDSWGLVRGSQSPLVGFSAYKLRTSQRPWFAPNLRVTKTDETYLLACTQSHQLMENRNLVRSATLTEYHKKPGFAAEPLLEHEREDTKRATPPLDFYEPYNYDPPTKKWGMVIDQTACIGCTACVIACQAENNIPVVGKTQVAAGRAMHWLRVDRYVQGTMDDPGEFLFQPVPCMHCEHAPCEYVCPVEATVHSAEGLNEMIYNRCVGTRFCSNNCPYKVRRFNFFHFGDYETPTLRLQYNPEVTVRSRGVMEKCSYCVQRIRQAEIDADRENRSIVDGEVITACQAACPAQAIVFGDLNDPKSAVAHWKSSPLNYGLLAELNTKPRTTYLAALRNPNPELESP
ncbi:MAG TPA: TAT-variant-translocated molybdopterin oxidoreductase [Planctomycetaceae bacterium]|jgi:molybdopterin-containing oxidoreductase family iron-sulfur binding subunit|nr:TAT-variant-translocated molybdopterin oxidoreductase [Planctomycetaceae bacterium]